MYMQLAKLYQHTGSMTFSPTIHEVNENNNAMWTFNITGI